jgi:pyrroloquinoline quinone (PQQ) biosynthesis protein C
MSSTHGLCRLDAVSITPDGVALTVNSREVSLGRRGLAAYRSVERLVVSDQLDHHRLASDPFVAKSVSAFARAGLLYPKDAERRRYPPEPLYRDVMVPLIDRWIEEAFSHPFWELMTSGRGTRDMYVGWLYELYHYTKNCNRHMPLAVAYARKKRVRTLLATHYHEEWNHYHFFAQALTALGYTPDQVAGSEPLPMTMEMSNFMRQAARENLLGYCLCSAILEGTTVDTRSYDSFYRQVAEHYEIPPAAIQPIYDHLDLDRDYAHSNLFLDVCSAMGEMSDTAVEDAIQYGVQMARHIWFWTDNIHRYYGDPANAIPRAPFDPFN